MNHKILSRFGLLSIIAFQFFFVVGCSEPEFVIEGDTLVAYNRNAKEVTIPNGVRHIGDGVFVEKKVVEIHFPEGLISIGDEAFRSCPNLYQADLPDTVQSIGVRAFYDCKELTEAILPDSLKTLEDEAFAYSSVWEVSVPSGIESVGVNAFEETSYATKGIDWYPEGGWPDELHRWPVSNGVWICSQQGPRAVIPYGVEKLCNMRNPNLDYLLLPPTIRDLENFDFNEGKIKTIYGIAGSETEKLAERYGIAFEPVALEQISLTLQVGEKYELALNSESDVDWESEDETIASVISTVGYEFYGGTITALAPGKTTVSAEIYGETFSCEVTVTE